MRQGTLLKVEHPGLGFGYADLFPWPELGDAPLSDQLDLLKHGIYTPQTRNALEFTRLDAHARQSGASLWEGLEIPKSHALATDPESLLKNETLEAILEKGFTRIKIKLGNTPESDAFLISRLSEELRGRAKLRLDFNSSLQEKPWKHFCRELSEEAIDTIDFIEDPVAWSSTTGFGPAPRGLKLALDRGSDSLAETQAYPEVLVVKPAVSNVRKLLQKAKELKKRLVFTSYLDHPLGQLWAAWSASKAAKEFSMEICGLLSQDAYEPHPWSKLLQTQGPSLVPPSGPGIGYQDALETLCEWRELQ